MMFKASKNNLAKNKRLLCIGYLGFIALMIYGKISKRELLNNLSFSTSFSRQIFDFLSGLGTGLAIIAILDSILIRRFGSVG